MYKAVVMLSDIKDIKEFQRYFYEEICPYLLQLPGLVRVDITSMAPISTEIDQEVKSVQMIFDVIYEDENTFSNILNSDINRKVSELVAEIDAKMSVFYGKETSLFPNAIPDINLYGDRGAE